MKYVAKIGLSLATGKRVEPGDKLDDKDLGKSASWLSKRGYIEELPEAKPKKEKDE